MEKSNLEALKYPIGKFLIPKNITDEDVSVWIEVLEEFPKKLSVLVEGLTKEQLDTPYRSGGWTVRQTVHHISDSHHNSYMRFKWALTEDTPVIKPYDEKAWAALFDYKTAPISLSLDHLRAVHAKLVYLLKGLSKEDLKKKFVHPDGHIATPLDENIGRYAWHSNHHYTHIQNLIQRRGWL